MIFVILGTQDIPFNRMLEMVDNLIERYGITEEVIAQVGHTQYNSKHFICIPFMNEEDFQEHVKRASAIITHAGSGALFSAIKSGKKAIAIARLKEYNEMPDNHQTELVKKLSLEGYILNGTYSLDYAWQQLTDFHPRSNDFICNIQDELLKILEIEN